MKKIYADIKIVPIILKSLWFLNKPKVAILFFSDFISGAFPFINIWIVKKIIDLVLSENQDGSSVFTLLILLFAVSVLTHIVSSLSVYVSSTISHDLSIATKDLIYQKINSFAGLRVFEDARHQVLIQAAAQGSEQSPKQLLHTLSAVIKNISTLSSFVIVLASYNILFLAVIVAAVIPELALHLINNRKKFNIYNQTSVLKRESQYYENLLTFHGSMKEIMLFNTGGFFLRKILAIYTELRSIYTSYQKKEMVQKIFSGAIQGLSYSVIFGVIVVMAIRKQISAGDLVLYMNTIMIIQGALISMIFAISQADEGIIFYKQYLALMALEEDCARNAGIRKPDHLTGKIEFINVSFKYDQDGPWILNKLNLTIHAGSCTALIGINGEGKTTIVKLLTRLYEPDEGEILWDGININQFDAVALRQHLGVVFQDFNRYDLSIKENIGLGNIQSIDNMEMIEQGASDVGLADKFKRLPKQYATLLSRWISDEKGVELSGGEWQKIAIARVLVRDCDVVVLDEPTASLDSQSEYDIFKKMSRFLLHRTCLIITHRFNTVHVADYIAVLQDGSVLEYGTHNELMQLDGKYRQLHDLQTQALFSSEPRDHATALS